MNNRLRALDLLEQQRQERLRAALASWQSYFAERAAAAKKNNEGKLTLDCTQK